MQSSHGLFYLFFSFRTFIAMAPDRRPPSPIIYRTATVSYFTIALLSFAFTLHPATRNPNHPRAHLHHSTITHGRMWGSLHSHTRKATRDVDDRGPDRASFSSQTTIFEISLIPVTSNPLDNRIHASPLLR